MVDVQQQHLHLQEQRISTIKSTNELSNYHKRPIKRARNELHTISHPQRDKAS
jgi:hypothetical protein